MIKLVKNIKYSNAMVIATLLSSVAVFNAQAVPVNSGSNEDISVINNTLNNSYLGVEVPNVDLSNIPEGSRFEYKSSRDEDGYHASAEASARYKKDFGDYINTNSETVTLLNVSAGFDSGISLGCNGLDMGMEALFEFDAGDILKYLPKYILTNLATEALAQIYATPLISAVMDGLKSMQNFTAEMKQASCSMNDVMTRANKIKKDAYDKCIAKGTANGPADEALESKCSDPSGLVEDIKTAQNYVSNRESTGTSISKLLNDNGVDYGDDKGTQVGDTGYTTGALMKMFIPDIKFSANGGSADYTKSKMDVGSVFNKAKNEAYNAIYNIYDDMIKTIRISNVPDIKTRSDIVDMTEKYKIKVMTYGRQEVFTDTNANNMEKYNPEQIAEIKKQFSDFSSLVFRSTTSKTGSKEFLIGPKNGTNEYLANKNSTYTGAVKSILLEAGNTCFVKVYKSDKEKKDYTWYKIQNSPEGLVSSSSVDADSISNSLIETISICKSLDVVKLDSLYTYMNKNEDLGYAYINKVASETAKASTESIVNIVNDKIDELLTTQETKLKTKCEAKGAASMPKEASYDGKTGQTFKTCDDYVEQNKMSDDTVKSLEARKEQLKERVKTLSDKVQAAQSDFFSQLYLTTND